MKHTSGTRARVLTIVAAASLVVVAGTATAYSAKMIGSEEIRNNSVESEDIKNNTLLMQDLGSEVRGLIKEGETGPEGPRGDAGPQGPAGSPFSYSGAEWSLIDRNAIGSFVGALRAGPSSAAFGAPFAPPLGVGSLGLQTGGPSDKVTFGNQSDFADDPLAGITTVKYSVFTTRENIEKAPGAVNLPGVTFEIDPTGPATTGTGGNYSSLVYVPVTAGAGWSSQDASAADQWFLTGAAGSGSCNQGPEGYCTLAEVKAKFPDATLHTVAVGKGRDYAFSGAVDALQINATTYDFEPTGVRSN